MIQSFYKSAIRTIQKNKLISLIKVFSLAIGISATLIIFLFIQYDYSFDKHVADKERVYRVVTNGTFKMSGLLVPLANILEAEASQIEVAVPLFQNFNSIIQIPKDNSTDRTIFSKERKIIFSNSQYFTLFPHTWLAGNANALDQPNTTVLTEESLNRFFPKLKPNEVLGKTLIFGDSTFLQVGGVVAEMKENSDFKYQVFVSKASIPVNPKLMQQFNWDQWSNYSDSYNLLVKLHQGVNPKTFEKTMLDIVKKNKKIEDGFQENFQLQPLSDVHYNADFNYNAIKKDTLRNLTILALFLLSLGVINFINLSTAQSIERAKEIGIRKTLGSSKQKLTMQFLMETFMIALFATIFSILITPILFKVFDGFLPANLTIKNLLNLQTSGFIIIQLLLVTLLAGFYPAWVMTGFSPVKAMKNQVSKNSKLSRSSFVRKVMTVFQFTLAQVFLICVLLVIKQISYVSTRDMGFDKDAIVNFSIPGFYQNSDKGKVLKNTLSDMPDIKAVSFGGHAPAINGMMTTSIILDKIPNHKGLNIDTRNGDENFINLYNIPLLAGRNVQLREKNNEVLINEKTLELLEVKTPEEALGQTFNKGQYTIVGVMKDFDFANARQAIKPLMYSANADGFTMHVKLDKNHPESWKNVLSKVEKEFKGLFPKNEIEYNFLDETIANFYQRDNQLSKLLTWALGISICIAGLGLFGLGIFTANQRTREIGIRKVLGASIFQIIGLLTKNLLSLILIACLIAFPIAWYFGNMWMQDFVYKTQFSWWLFPLSAFGLLSVATIVLLSKTYFAAKANPVDSLRDE